MEGSILQLARLHAWIAPVVTSLTERKMGEGHRQNTCADTYASYVTVAIRKLVGRVGSFLKACEPDKIYCTPAQFNSECVVQQKRALLEK